MDTNCTTNYLNDIFQEVVITGITSQNLNTIEKFLIKILDNEDYSIFSNNLFLNLIFLLETKETSLIIKHLIQEIKLKSLRVIYTSGINYENNNCCEGDNRNNNLNKEELPFFEGLQLPPKGKNSFAKEVYEEDGKEIVKTYLIDHTGQALQLLNVEIKEFNEDLDKLNNSLLNQTYEVVMNQEISENVPLTEDDL